MTLRPSLVHGDHISCSRLAGAMRRESARLLQQAQSLEDALDDLDALTGEHTAARYSVMTAVSTDPPVIAALGAITVSLKALRASAKDLDEAGAVLQRYSTDLAEGHELGRRAELRVESAGLLLDGARVIEPWGLASTQEAARRRTKVPEVQARVDLATAHVGRARGRLGRALAPLTENFSRHSRAARSTREPPVVARALTGPT